jgi:hypothetical protein
MKTTQKQIEDLKKNQESYDPSLKDLTLIKRIYDEFSLMRDVTNKPYKYFNNRTLTQFIDDSEKRFNSYVPSRASQGKEKWQANFFHPTTKNKTMAILASVALDVPPIRITASNEKNEVNMKVATIVADLVKASYNNEEKEENNFFEVLDGAVKGTVISYDGYLKTKVKRKEITSFNVITGEVEYEEKEITIDEGCKDFIVPLENFFVSSAFIRKIQDQPAIVWAQYMNINDFTYEFNNYAKFKYVKVGSELIEKDIQKRFFYEDWNTRTKERPIEVLRYYNKINDEYIIIANGILMLSAPMLLGQKRKYYPFSKGGYCPFASDFFWMNSLPNALMGEQDIINSFYNMVTDKTYKGLVTNLLIGNTNKDDFDLMDQNITLDSKIYVQDINQVKEMPNSGVTSSEFNMIKLISSGLDLSSVDSAQQGVQGNGVTAREVIIANENARKLKGIFFLFITNMWLQKIKLRTLNVLINSTTSKMDAIVGTDKVKQFRKFIVEGTELSDGTKGNKGVIIANDKKDLPTQSEIDQNVEEYKGINPDTNYEEIAVTSEYLNNWEYKIKIVSEDLYQKDSSYSVSKNEDKIKTILAAFPEYFKKNQEKLFKDTLISNGEDVDEYDLDLTPPEETETTSTDTEAPPPTEETPPPAETSAPNLNIQA